MNMNNLELHEANSAYSLTTKSDLIKYLHQCLYSPPKIMLVKAITNNQLTMWPGLTNHAREKYLEDAPATDKGHMQILRQGIRSTPKEELRDKLHAATEVDMYPPKKI